MDRSYRGVGLVGLVLLVVAPLSLFAVLAVFEKQSQDSIRLSTDGVHWKGQVDGALLATQQPWTPGQVRSAIVYVRNSGPAPVDANVVVTARSTDDLIRDGYLSLGAIVGDGNAASLPEPTTANDVVVNDLGSGDSVPVTLTATFEETAPIGSTLDSRALLVRLEVSGARTEESGSPSLLDATGAQLWLAPVFLFLAAAVALFGSARRRARSGRTRR